MKHVVLVAAACACRTPRAPSPPLPDRTPYLALFDQGLAFSLAAREGRTTGTVRCTVDSVAQVGDANVSRLACAPPHESLLVNGTWVATPAGLYHPHLPIDSPDELALLGDDELLITTRPRERVHTHRVDGTSETVETFGHAGSWCVRQTTSAGDDLRGFTLCFDGHTITGGSDLVRAGGRLQRIDFGDTPPHGDDGDDDDSEAR
jgi:hypothetical protein